jgi:hypothetical protein
MSESKLMNTIGYLLYARSIRANTKVVVPDASGNVVKPEGEGNDIADRWKSEHWSVRARWNSKATVSGSALDKPVKDAIERGMSE